MIDRSLRILEHYKLLENAQLKSAEIAILCPFHEEVEPSCFIKLEEERYYCFGCEATGDLADLVAHLEHTNKVQALLRIGKIMQGFASAYAGAAARIILEPIRKLTTQEAIQQSRGFFFSIGKPSWDDISKHYLLERGFTPQTLKRFDARINSSSDYPVIFPIWENGRFKGYMTRALDNREDKYRMSRGMRKTEVLYGRIKPGQLAIVTEGALDAWKTYQNLRAIGDDALLRLSPKGYGIVTPLNWSASDTQLEKLGVADGVISAMDNDRAGRDGTDRLKRNLRMPVTSFQFPSWVHDMAELEPREFQAGLNRALRALAA